jgi:hypothetical protein
MTWTDKQTNTALKTLALVTEVTGATLSEAAVALILRQVSRFPYDAVIRALERCANECTRAITLADIVQRIDDGRPSTEEAWARVPKSENDAAVMSEEMLAAWGAARLLYYEGDHVAARMAFKEVYDREMRNARAASRPAVWILSAGFDRASTEAAAYEGARSGKLSLAQAKMALQPEAIERLERAMGVAQAPSLLTADEKVELRALLGDAIKALSDKAMPAALPAPASE